MLSIGTTFRLPSTGYSIICQKRAQLLAREISPIRKIPHCISSVQMLTTAAVAAAASAVIFSVVVAEAGAGADTLKIGGQQQQQQQESESETLSNIPQTLSGECFSGQQREDCKKARIQRPKSRKAETCTVKCVNTCIRGGLGSPGEGPLNVRKPLVVFKQGFRSRQYCLVECSDICNLIGDGDDGP